MKPSQDKELLEIVKATGELYGKQTSVAAIALFLIDLDSYSAHAITKALAKCRMELRTFPTVADVIARIDDGRPGIEEAWSLCPQDEYRSVVWNNEIAEAWRVANNIEDDKIGARMAFKESYSKIIADNRANGKAPEWFSSFGWDKHGHKSAVLEAVIKNRISVEHAKRLLPDELFENIPAQISGPNGAKINVSGLLR